jgi:hypothetical protein
VLAINPEQTPSKVSKTASLIENPARMRLAAARWGLAFVSFAYAEHALPQGCIPARHVALSLGSQGLSYLQPNQWELSVSYRYLYSEDVFIGQEEQPQFKARGSNPIVDMHSFDVALTYAITRRTSATITLPFTDADNSTIHGDTKRHTMHAGGLGDIRLTANVWLFDPLSESKGNLLFSLGFKAPTGDERVIDTFHRATGPELRPVDISIQPGDGGWGIVPEMQAYLQLFTNAYAYLSGFYLLNPRIKNDTETTRSVPGNVVLNSVPDEYSGRLGLSYSIWREQGLALSLGGRIDGIPVRDLIGGGDDGFRRPGYSVYIEPAMTVTRGKYTFTLSGPVALLRNEEQSIRDARAGIHTAGGLADFLILASLARRF